MRNPYDLISRITSPDYSPEANPGLLNDFADELGWRPSDRLLAPAMSDIATAHLVVEHGLQNAAVLTFLKSPRGFSDLTFDERIALMNMSYNNLVDWHIHIQANEVAFVYNRTNPATVVATERIERGNVDMLRVEAFDIIVGRRPNPNLPALDEALIRTISFWKRNLAAEMGDIPSHALSTLINAVIMARAAEDNSRRRQVQDGELNGVTSRRALLQAFDQAQGEGRTLQQALVSVLTTYAVGPLPADLVNRDALALFDEVSEDTAYAFLADFYRSKFAAPYEYDFSLISKHALSCIYEHYVSILRMEEEPQALLPLFRSLPLEDREKAFGSVYTPQFIARFFARYLREYMPPGLFKRMVAVDPACGSGIFLRSLLELLCDPSQDGGITSDFIRSAFGNMKGMDADPNACEATRLSLALLHLVLTDELATQLDVVHTDALPYFVQHPQLADSADAVIANPPFVALANQSAEQREALSQFLGDDAQGRVDLYLAFIKIAIEMLKPGGYGLFVVPRSFLIASSASRMRRLLRDTAWVRCLADLSAISVFEDSKAYVALLIFQKKHAGQELPPPATIVRCQAFVNRALQMVIDGKHAETAAYSVYEVGQHAFDDDAWIVLPPGEYRVKHRMTADGFPTISEFLDVRKGFASGADKVFILPVEEVPEQDTALWMPFLPDRQMNAYSLPSDTGLRFFYPYVEGRKVEADELEKTFSGTWEYLLQCRPDLEGRGSARTGAIQWWEPERPRPYMKRPKIVSPHLTLTPRFGLDRDGTYAVTQAPLLLAKNPGDEADDLLRYFLAVLNSSVCAWYIAQHCHKYARGYSKLEPVVLKRIPVPDPSRVGIGERRRLLSLVDARMEATGAASVGLEQEIDCLVASLYGLDSSDRGAIGMGGG